METCPFCHQSFTYEEYTFQHQRLNGSCVHNVLAQPLAPRAVPDQAIAAAQASASPQHSDHYVHQLIEQAEKPLAVVGAVAPGANSTPGADDSTLASAHAKFEALLAANLSVTVLQQCLDYLKEGGAYTPSTFSARELVLGIREQYCGSAFEHHDISAEFSVDPGTYFLSVRRDPVALVLRLFEQCPPEQRRLFPERVKDEHGQRVYNDFSTAERWNRVQVRVWHHMHHQLQSAVDPTNLSPDDDVALQDMLGWTYPIVWFVPWTDKVHYDGAGRLVGHALTISVGESACVCMGLCH